MSIRDDSIERGSSVDLAPTVAQRWRKQYGPTPVEKFAVTQRRLDELGADATYEDVEQIIGNQSWTRVYCDLCTHYATEWVRLGDRPDYDSPTIHACLPCLRDVCRIISHAPADEINPKAETT